MTSSRTKSQPYTPNLPTAAPDYPADRSIEGVTLAGTTLPVASPVRAVQQPAQPVPTAARPATDRDVDAVLHRPPTTTPPFPNRTLRGDVVGQTLTPGILRALLQPVVVFTVREPALEYEPGDVVAAQFWREGYVNVTPLPAAAARGRVPTTFVANVLKLRLGERDVHPGILRSILQPVLFVEVQEAFGAFEPGDVLAAQFWGDGRIMLSPLPGAASRGRIPVTFAASQFAERVKLAEPNGHAERAATNGVA